MFSIAADGDRNDSFLNKKGSISSKEDCCRLNIFTSSHQRGHLLVLRKKKGSMYERDRTALYSYAPSVLYCAAQYGSGWCFTGLFSSYYSLCAIAVKRLSQKSGVFVRFLRPTQHDLVHYFSRHSSLLYMWSISLIILNLILFKFNTFSFLLLLLLFLLPSLLLRTR